MAMALIKPVGAVKFDQYLRRVRGISSFIALCGVLFSATVSAELAWRGNGFGTIAGGVLDSDSINEVNAFAHNQFDSSFQLAGDCQS